jgi:hypothetical protein
LTKSATQVASCKKDGAASLVKGNARFLEWVQVVFCNPQAIYTARANAREAICSAFHGAKCAIFYQNRIHNVYYSTIETFLQAIIS